MSKKSLALQLVETENNVEKIRLIPDYFFAVVILYNLMNCLLWKNEKLEKTLIFSVIISVFRHIYMKTFSGV